MTAQQAISYLEMAFDNSDGEDLSELYKDMCRTAIEALKRQCIIERTVRRLEEEGKLADEERDRCARENPLQFDRAVGYSNGIFNAIDIIKEEMGYEFTN